MYKQNLTSQANYLVYFILSIIPVIQLGLSFYVSFFFLSFLIVFLFSIKGLKLDKATAIITFAGASIFLLKGFLLSFVSVETRDVFIPVREMFCYVGLFFMASELSKANLEINTIRRYFLWFFIVVLTLILIQSLFILQGQYLGFPIQYFAINQGTLANADKALMYGTRFRPTSFYGEPSYTAWIVVSFLVIILSRIEFTNKVKWLLISFCLTIVTISQSLSGILAVCILTATWITTGTGKKLNIKFIFLSVIGIIIGISLVLYFSEDFANRLSAILSNSDESSTVRFNNPLVYFNGMIENNLLFGVSNFGDLDIDNAAWGLVIQYGILSVAIAILVIKFLGNKFLIIYFFIAMNFNGSLFGFDKILVISMVVGLSRCTFYQAKSLRQMID